MTTTTHHRRRRRSRHRRRPRVPARRAAAHRPRPLLRARARHAVARVPHHAARGPEEPRCERAATVLRRSQPPAHARPRPPHERRPPVAPEPCGSRRRAGRRHRRRPPRGAGRRRGARPLARRARRALARRGPARLRDALRSRRVRRRRRRAGDQSRHRRSPLPGAAARSRVLRAPSPRLHQGRLPRRSTGCGRRPTSSHCSIRRCGALHSRRWVSCRSPEQRAWAPGASTPSGSRSSAGASTATRSTTRRAAPERPGCCRRHPSSSSTTPTDRRPGSSRDRNATVDDRRTRSTHSSTRRRCTAGTARCAATRTGRAREAGRLDLLVAIAARARAADADSVVITTDRAADPGQDHVETALSGCRLLVTSLS